MRPATKMSPLTDISNATEFLLRTTVSENTPHYVVHLELYSLPDTASQGWFYCGSGTTEPTSLPLTTCLGSHGTVPVLNLLMKQAFALTPVLILAHFPYYLLHPAHIATESQIPLNCPWLEWLQFVSF